MRHTARATIIRNKKILLLTGHDAGFYWTPGGGIDEGESAIEALHREIREELGVEIISYKHYLSYEHNTNNVTNFLVTINDEFAIDNEITDFIWYGKNDKVRLSSGLYSVLLPKLIQDGLL